MNLFNLLLLKTLYFIVLFDYSFSVVVLLAIAIPGAILDPTLTRRVVRARHRRVALYLALLLSYLGPQSIQLCRIPRYSVVLLTPSSHRVAFGMALI